MAIHPLVGHHVERAQVQRALQGGRLPQLLLLTGAPGVGKQRFGLWTAAAVLCEAASSPPCGHCQQCRMAAELTHPDLHWVMPVLRPKASEPERQVDELAESIAQVIEKRRKNPLYGPPEGLEGHFVSTARLILRRASMTPAMGRRKVFLIAEADRLVPQESSPEAANVLLKLFEEPPADTQFILTVVDPNRLISTVRSRAVPLRLGRLADSDVEEFLRSRVEGDGPALGQRVAAAHGSLGRALALGDEDAKARKAAEDLLRAVADGAAAQSERALKQGPWQARGDFTAMLDALAALLSEGTRVASGAAAGRPLPGILARQADPSVLAAAQGRVAAAREAAQGNVNPQLLVASLAQELAEVL